MWFICCFLCLKYIFGSFRDWIGVKKGYYYFMIILFGKYVILKVN